MTSRHQSFAFLAHLCHLGSSGRPWLPLAWMAAMLAGIACSRTDDPSEPRGAAAHSAPWPARPVSSALPREEDVALYELTSKSEVTFEIPGRRRMVSGRVRVLEGKLTVDLANLQRTRGFFAFDVASIVLAPLTDAGSSRYDSALAHNWLDVGASRPEPERERLRWARFEITEVTDLSAPSASLGKELTPTGSALSSGTVAEGSVPTKQRSVLARVVGFLNLHARQVAAASSVQTVFSFRNAEDTAAAPDTIEIRSTRPFLVSLDAHDIEPRDSLGRSRSPHDDPLAGELGNLAQVSFLLHLRLTRAAQGDGAAEPDR